MVTNSAGSVLTLDSAPYVITQDLSSEVFNVYNNIYIEMVLYRKKNKKPNYRPGGGYIVPAPWYPNGSFPYPAWGNNYWNRSGNHQNNIVNGLIGVDRPNHFEVIAHNQYINLAPMISGRWQEFLVKYRDASGQEDDYYTYVPSANKRSQKNLPTSRFAYSPVYIPMYVAFRYVAWDGNAGPINPVTGLHYGEIVSGPLSRVIKIIHHKAPFMLDYAASALYGNPCAFINPLHVPTQLKCMFETHLP
jgi:hypothetical protein